MENSPPFMHDDMNQRRSGFLGWALVVLIVFGGAMFASDIAYYLQNDIPFGIDFCIMCASLASFIACLFLNRAGYFKIAASVTTIVMIIAVFALAVPSPSPDDVGMLYFVVIPILFANILLEFRVTVIIAVGITIGMVLFDMVVENVDSDAVPVFTAAIVGGFSIFAARYQHITDRKRAEKLQYIGTHDDLTGLPNRNLLEDRLNMAIRRSRRDNTSFAILFITLSDIKRINDAFGHQIGDQILIQVGKLLTGNLRSVDTVARFFSDKFAVVTERITDRTDEAAVADKILRTLRKPIVIQEREYTLTARVGISVFPRDGQDAKSILRNADTALSYAKDNSSVSFFNESMTRVIVEKVNLSAELRNAVGREMRLVYQPQVDPATCRVSAVEALLRWHHPKRGVLAPGAFLSVAEESGFMVEIGDWTIEESCRQLREWIDHGISHIRISVNVAGQQLQQHHLYDVVKTALETYRVPPGMLELELTENIIFRNFDHAIDLLNRLKSLGVRIAIDDFGAGFSTLHQLSCFPADVLKIDKIFADSITQNGRDRAVVHGIASIASNLGLEVVAEGVETAEQLDAYLEICDPLIQGYLFSKPISPDACEELIRENIPCNWSRSVSA